MNKEELHWPKQSTRPHFGFIRRASGRTLLSGEILRINASSAEDGSWVLGTLVPSNESTPVAFLAKGVGGLLVGRLVSLDGFWETHPQYGEQFLVESCVTSELPRDRAALVRYLSANVAGLGKRRSELLVAALGEAVLVRLNQEPEVVKRIFPGGLGERIALGVYQWIGSEDAERWSIDVAPKLMAVGGIQYSQAKKIISYFTSAEVADLIARRDPYRLLEVPGIGWHRADAIALNMGIAPDADERVESALQFSHEEALRRGDSAMTRSALIAAATRLTSCSAKDASRALVRSTIYCELVRSKGVIFRPDILQAEWAVADLVNQLLRRSYSTQEPEPGSITRFIEKVRLNDAQAAAVWAVLRNGISIITGGPGTGKTHTLRALALISQDLKIDFRVVAPTGKAAVRAAAVCGVESTTIHKLLGGAPGGLRQSGPIRTGILVIEESSMVDLALMSWLAGNIRPGDNFRLVLVGDSNQLPPINHGQVLADLISSGKVPITELRIVRRQAAGSAIIDQSNRILRGEPLEEAERSDWRFVELPSDPNKAQALFLRAVRRVIQEEYKSIIRKVQEEPFNPSRDLQILSPRNTGPLGVTELNSSLKRQFNMSSRTGPWIGGGERVHVGDRVVCTQNDYTVGNRGLMNGEQGVVIEVTGDTTTLRTDDGSIVRTRGVQNNNLSLAFCMSVHRAQGSEYPVVVVVFHSSHYPLLDTRLLYTALTRSRSRTILCADRAALSMLTLPVSHQRSRLTRLASRIVYGGKTE